MDPRNAAIASVFAAGAVFSALVSLHRGWKGRKGGNISLPRDENANVATQASSVFDTIVRPNDFIDGFPLDEAAFWARVRWRKYLLLGLLVAVGLSSLRNINAVDLGAIQTVFAVYLVLLAALSVATADVAMHAYYTTTLAVLTTSAFFILAGDALLPKSSKADGRLSPPTNNFPTITLYFTASLLSLTTPRGPKLHLPPGDVYPPSLPAPRCDSPTANNVHGVVDATPLAALFFTYISKITTLPAGFGIADLPLLTAAMRAPFNFTRIRRTTALRACGSPTGDTAPARFGLTLILTNARALLGVQLLSALIGALRYVPAFCVRKLLLLLEGRKVGAALADADEEEIRMRWGYVYVTLLFLAGLASAIGWGQLWNLVHITDVQITSQVNSVLFVKTLVRKEVVDAPTEGEAQAEAKTKKKPTPVHKAQILTLMSQDTQRASELSKHVYTVTDALVQLVCGTWLLYSLLGISCFVGLLATLICLPVQHYGGKAILRTQSALMKAKDERISLTNEVLAGIRMIKFMAWERNFEARLWGVREKELTRQRITYTLKSLLTAVGNLIPIFFALASFGHYTVVRHEILTPSIAFTAITVFNSIQSAISGFPEALLGSLQCFVSLRRIDQYLEEPEVAIPESVERARPDLQGIRIFLSSASLTWPISTKPTTAAPELFSLSNLSVEFPVGELSLVCGKVGSGKSLLLLALLGEAEVARGEVVCPRSPPDFLASCSELSPSSDAEWVVPGVCAYVPQTAWLRNQSIRDNILFELPFNRERYTKTLEVCALLPDLEILEYGDFSEIGERGINLSGGQKARVSLARAVYSRASILLLDDILSAVDVHTARHMYHTCLKGDLMHGRTVILVSHHIQLCADGAAHIVALENGTVGFQGKPTDFRNSAVFRGLLQTKPVASASESKTEASTVSEVYEKPGPSTASPKSTQTGVITGKAPKVVIDEVSSVGRIHLDVWKTYLQGNGGWSFWFWFSVILFVASLGPVFENAYLRKWSDDRESARHGPVHYLSVYAGILCIDLLFRVAHFFILYHGSIHASRVLYEKLLEAVLFSGIRFHDTIARGSLLNRFGKDFQVIDGSIADDFGRALKLGIAVVVTFTTVTVVGGLPFLSVALVLGLVYYLFAKEYGHTSRDMRRLVSTTTSPLYSVYDTAISGVLVIRSFGASTTFLRNMMRFVDANSCANHWQWGLNRWFSVISTTFGGAIIALIGLVALLSPSIDPSLAGLALVFASNVAVDLMYFQIPDIALVSSRTKNDAQVRAYVGLEQCLVAVERVKDTSDLPREAPEVIDPRPPANWPSRGEITCEDLSVRYTTELPDVLHHLNFHVLAGEKIAVVGRTASGKSTLALSFFRSVEASGGKLIIDGIDISTLGLTDLRRNLTIIPQDPTLMSGTIRSTLDVFNEHEDAEIFEALRRVHLISGASSHPVFSNLDSPVSQGGSNFSTGEKQLLCMARAILRHSKVLIIDEATASVDYATDELIGAAIREKFSESTVLTIAHRLRSIIDYDKVMVLEDGRIVEFDRPKTLLKTPTSVFFAMCMATGKDEFATLKSLAGL